MSKIPFIELQTFHKGRRIKLEFLLVIAYNCSLQFYKQQLQPILNKDQILQRYFSKTLL